MTTAVNEIPYKDRFKSVLLERLSHRPLKIGAILKNFPTEEDHFQDYGHVLDLFRNYSDLLFEKSLLSYTVSNFLIDKDHQALESYDTLQFHIYGAGGVTSWLLPQLVKTLYAFSRKFNEREIKAEIVLYDGDIVETKNILRQNFIPEDVGKNKAQVLSDRYNELYPNIKVKYVPKYIYDSSALILFDKLEEFKEENSDLFNKNMFFDLRSTIILRNSPTIYINLVDNELTKHMLDHYLYNRLYSDNVGIYCRYFSAGCDINTGHVFTTNVALNPSPYILNFDEFTWKEDSDSIHQEATYSCAEIAENLTIEQTFNSNSFAATILNNLIDSFISDPFSFDVKKVKFVCGALPTMTVKERDVYHLHTLIALLARILQTESSEKDFDYDFIVTDSNKDRVEEFQTKVKYLESKYLT